MAMYSFSLESFTAVACRGVGGVDDVWVVMAVSLGGERGHVTQELIGRGVQAGEGFTGPWSTGPYQVAEGEAGVVAYALVNVAGTGDDDQAGVVAALGAKILAAVQAAVAIGAGAGAAAAGGPPQAVRDVFGAAGELVGAPPLAAGIVDCRGLVGVYVAAFTAAGSAPEGEVVETTDPVTLTAAAPATCGAGTQGEGVFSMRRGPNLFSQSTPVTALASATGEVELFAVGMDGLVRYSVRSGAEWFGAWQVVGGRRFSQSAPVVAVAGLAQRKDVFGTGTDGVIYNLNITPDRGWKGWSAVSPLGMFLPDTPVSAVSLSGVLTLAAVDGDGVAQSITWKGDAVLSGWGPLGNMIFERRLPLLLLSHVDPWVEVFAVSPQGQDYHTSRANNAPTWGPWQSIGSSIDPASRQYCGLTFDVFGASPNASLGLGMTWFRVDGVGHVNQLGWTGAGWIPRQSISGLKTASAGPVAGVRVGLFLLLFMVDAETGQVGAAEWRMPSPFFATMVWSQWGLLPAGPLLARDRAVTLICADNSHVEVFVVDREGLMHHLTWTNPAAKGTWAIV